MNANLHETDIFQAICQETSRLCAMNATQLSLSKGRWKRWEDLLDIWKIRIPGGYDLLYNVIHHIQWGRFPYSSKCGSKALFYELLETAILCDSDVVKAWRSRVDFQNALNRVLNTAKRRASSYEFEHYIRCRTLNLLFYRDEYPVVDLATVSIRELRCAKNIAQKIHDCSNFERTIITILPEAAAWKSKDWLSLNRILGKLKAAHGVDYAKDISAFDALVRMAKHKLDGTPYYDSLLHVKNVPDSIARLLWPQMEKELGTEFCKILRWSKIYVFNAKKREWADIVHGSWIYSWVMANLDNGISKTVKKRLMEFEMGLNAA